MVLFGYLGFMLIELFFIDALNQLPVKPMTFWEYVAGIISLSALHSI